MAENIGFNVKVGMDVAEMQSELQKAQNLLREFQAQLKKSTNTIEINMLNNEIKTLTTQINSYGQALNKLGKPAGDATQSLVNLSRIAQDAPYGFMGIANNLNPMLESFQNLAKTEGGTKNALKAMAEGLAGPAGIGVALGIVSSLIVAFGDKIGAFIQKVIVGNDSLKEQTEALKGIGAEFTSSVEKVNKVSIAFEEYRNKIITGSEALKIYNDELGKNFGVKSNINEAEKVFKDKTDAYIEASFQRALADSASKKAAEELLKEKIKLAEGPKNTLIDYIVGVGQGGINKGSLSRVANENLKEDVSASEKLIATYKEIAKKAKEASDELVKSFKLNLTPDKRTTSGTDNTLQNSIKEIVGEGFASERLRRNMKGEDLSLVFLDTPESVVAKEKKRLDSIKTLLKPIIDSMASETGFGGLLMKKAAIDAPKFKAEDAEKKRENDAKVKEIKEQEQAYKQFANTIANDVTGAIMGMWDAMQKGENPLKSIGDMLSRLAEELVATAIKAAIFSAIISALPSAGGVVGANGGQAATGFFDIFKQLLGIGVTKNAAGGITNGPSLGLIGEAGPEAIMPLSKLSSFLNTSFNAGAMSGSSTGNGGQFVLRGQDLLLAVNRTQKASNLKGQSISLA